MIELPVQLKENVRHNGKVYNSGDIVSVFTNDEEKRLVKLDSAIYFDYKKIEVDKEKVKNTSIPPDDPDKISEEDFKKLHDTLDKAFNKDPLIKAAESVGVELTEEDKKLKDKVIEEIILQGLENEVLAEKENE